jgi:hypothetical protein
LRPFNTHKLQFRSKQCVFLGYNTLHKGFKCLDVAEGRVYVSHDVVFDQTVYPFSKLNPNVGARLRGEIQLLPSNSTFMPSSASGDELIVDSTAHMPLIPMPTNASCLPMNVEKNPGENHAGIQEENVFTAADEGPCSSAQSVVDPIQISAQTAIEDPKADLPIPASPFSHEQESSVDRHMSPAADSMGSSVLLPSGGEILLASARPSTRLQHGIRKPKLYTDGTVRYGLLTSSGEPQNHNEALRDDKWKKAMDDEFSALQKNRTWHLVPAKSGANVIDCKWVYKIKRN